MAELMACRREVEVASMLSDPNKNLSAAGPRVKEIEKLMQEFREVNDVGTSICEYRRSKVSKG